MLSANKNCLLLKSGKWMISQDGPPESHVSLPIGEVSPASWILIQYHVRVEPKHIAWMVVLPNDASWEKSHDVTQAGLDLRSSCLNLPDARDLDISPVPSLCNLKHPSKTVIEVAFWITWLPSFSRGWHLKDFISWGLVLLRYPEVSVTHLLLLPVYQIPVVSNHRSASFPKFQENGSWNKRRTKVVSNIKQHCLNE